ncbi:hypothetical protein C6P46_001672 [Rhodotorula mucilaginosa]|uniref:Ubiquitin-like domain-containing protein n=1 Tax=Rhodotorula mucilaginosa TaxID=5537 RepID=A0A9P6W4B5_RHOMI|nr:hypothetical protein C6P46_001672 [Rhodotorula mucilaginosa]TKA51493.1 hypothetical protein B0A53_05548 [Rhodotorula sp. CCFEE 5036]
MGVKGDADAGDVKPNLESTKHTLTIRLGTDQDELTIKASLLYSRRVKGTTKFAKIYQAVAQQTGKDKGSFTLTHEGRRVGENETPADLDFEEEECLDLHLAQLGGGGGDLP